MSTSPAPEPRTAPEPPADDPVDLLLRFARRTGVRLEAARRLTEEDREILEETARRLTPEAAGVVAAVTDVRKEDLFPRLAALPERDRGSCVPYLERFLRLLRDDWDATSIRYERHRQILRLAGVACEPTPAAAVRWIISDELWWAGTEPRDTDRLLQVLADRPARWRADLVARVMERCDRTTESFWYPLVRGLLLMSDLPPPEHDAFVQAWMRDLTHPHWHPAGGRHRTSSRPDTLLDRLRDDPFRDTLLPRIFRGGTVAQLAERGAGGEDADRWPRALAALAAEGRLDRAFLIDTALACLLRGGRPSDLTACFEVFTSLDPTDDECGERVPVLLRLLSETPSAVAEHVQRRLRALDDAGRLTAEQFADASRSVLFRPQKKLLRAQLSWLDRSARRDASRAGVVVSAVTGLFGHEDVTLQERAWQVAARHLPHAPEEVRAGLAAASAALHPGLRDRAAGLLGTAPSAAAEPADLLPPVAVPAPLAPPPATPAEVAEEVGAVVQRPRGGWAAVRAVDVPTFERALDGLVRHAHRDLDGLVAALEPVARACPWDLSWRSREPWEREWRPGDLRYVLAHLLGEEDPGVLWAWREQWLPGRAPSRFSRVIRARLHEVAQRLATDPPPFLLATPTAVDGRIDPAELVARIAAYEDAGVSPGEVDLSQALLRVDAAACPDEVLDRAGKLAGSAGRRLAAWLAAGGLPEPVERAPWDGPGGDGTPAGALLVASGAVAPPGALHEVFGALLEGGGVDDRDLCRHLPDPHWPAMLPVSRRLLALRLQRAYVDAADGSASGTVRLLPVLAEAGGGAGTALHMGVACALGVAEAEDRPAAVDALLALAARGDLDAALLGRCLGEAVRVGAVVPTRLAAALRDAAAGGAYGTVWSVLEAVLPGLLRCCDGPAPRGLADLVAVGAECAGRCGARGEIPEVTQVAARKGRTRLVREARALRDALAAG